METTDYRLSDLLDMSLLQKLADSSFSASGIPMSIIDAIDTSVLVKAGWTDICLKFHRVHPLTIQRCIESDASMYDRLTEGEAYRYRCKNGMWHFAIPILVGGRHLGTMFLTQFLFVGEVPEREYFIRQAEEFGYDRDAYLTALDNVPVFSVEKVNYILAYDMALVRFIADLAEQSLRTIEAKESLRASEVKYRTLVDNVNIGVYRNDPVMDRFIQANPAMMKIFGYASVEQFMGIPLTDLYQNHEDRERYGEELKQHGFVKDRALAMRKKDGTPIWCSATATAQFDGQGNITWIDGVLEDITERKKAEDALQKAYAELETRVQERTADLEKANNMLLEEIAERTRIEEKLRELSEIDPLTAIYNRRKLFELLGLETEKARRYERPLSLLIFDLDHFKKVNDKFGHDVGDIVLKITAHIIGDVIRNADIFARYGGEEFIIVSPETDINGAVALAEKVRATVEHYGYPAAGKITISAGVAELSAEDSGATLIKRADERLYAAKKQGRNRVEAATPKPKT
jgi:diguanylate cyclase (GGDEF)-like protein/PAS domain S-box-containing protein